MDDNMEMQEWLEANKEIYSDFKSKIQSVLNNWLCDNGTELNDDETDTFQNLLVEAMDEEGGTAENLIDGFSKAIKEGNVSACCLYCYLELDNGYEEMAKAMSKFEKSKDAQYFKDGIKVYLQDKRRESHEVVIKDLNMLSLRRWHYEHSKEYLEFTDFFAKAYEGDMTFSFKGMSYLAETLSLDGIKGIIKILGCLCPGTESYNKAQFANDTQQAHEKLKDLFATTFSQETTKRKLQHNNPFLLSAFYWMIFDNGFVKAADLLSKIMMDDGSSNWQKSFGGQIMRSLLLTSMDKAGYTKSTWKSMNKGETKDVVSSTLQETKGRRGRKQVYILLEEMLVPAHAEVLTHEIRQILSEWVSENDTDSILPYLFAALTNCKLLNDTYNYRTFHTAILEKFPNFGFKSGFDWGEALYNAIISDKGYDYNLSLSENAVQFGKEQAKLLGIRLRTRLSPDVY